MNTKFSLALVAMSLTAAAAFAQTSNVTVPADLRTSTPGNGCTATANAMAGGNLGGSPTGKGCTNAEPVAVQAPAPAVVATPMAPAPAAAPVYVAPAPAPAAPPPVMAAAPVEQPVRMAKADRN